MNSHFFDHCTIICGCESPEHQIIFAHEKIENKGHPHYEDDFYVEVHLHQYRSFFKRLWVAVKYVFGYHCKYGHWDTTIFTKEDATKLKDFLEKYEQGT